MQTRREGRAGAGWPRWARRIAQRLGVISEPADPDRAGRARRIRDRLAAVELERLEVLADESVPARRHRLDALALARDDLQAQLGELGAIATDSDAVQGTGMPLAQTSPERSIRRS